MIEISPDVRRPDLPVSRSELRRLLAASLAGLGLSGKSLGLRVVSDPEITELNVRYLGLPGPTNVLSFPVGDPDQPDYLGDIAISAETVAREAFLYGQDPARHLARMLCHGILHLAGLDHGPRMFSLTESAIDMATR
ncbi:rRNA maturation RNase YbeY [Desulfolutivibrio sulfoxidireducens]|uniref:rRNA maturation RNase YbeY n=1 Tax=Desulfolutivibrio sulfoxidireducens TaxID=2773299 RepID=UPI00159E25F6|nr:rRNA maturation RNase YbeY [Desulfolutivibrio sulfoxidireducens]QLA16558.1 rRNA maturation RNase YbeY [Desulfolutivibrio sulfoxidireducens]QLA19560.1 rRNA maturation RNase YbeY [Desulfolutivibrio sulfoxidireducens]